MRVVFVCSSSNLGSFTIVIPTIRKNTYIVSPTSRRSSGCSEHLENDICYGLGKLAYLFST